MIKKQFTGNDQIILALVYPIEDKRLAEVWKAGAWGFKIGSALFDKKFAPDGSFLDNTIAVCNWLQKTEPTQLDQYLSR